MAHYSVGQDATIRVDYSEVSDEIYDDGEMAMVRRDNKNDQRNTQGAYKTGTKPGKGNQKRLERFYAKMLVLFSLLSIISLFAVFAGGVYLGTKSLLEYRDIVSKVIKQASETMDDTSSEEDAIQVNASVQGNTSATPLLNDVATTIKTDGSSFSVTANGALVVILLEYVIAFCALIIFMKFTSVDIQG